MVKYRLFSGTGSDDVLRQAQVPILNNTQCAGWYGSNIKGGIKPGMMCAGYQFGGMDACQVICSNETFTKWQMLTFSYVSASYDHNKLLTAIQKQLRGGSRG